MTLRKSDQPSASLPAFISRMGSEERRDRNRSPSSRHRHHHHSHRSHLRDNDRDKDDRKRRHPGERERDRETETERHERKRRRTPETENRHGEGTFYKSDRHDRYSSHGPKEDRETKREERPRDIAEEVTPAHDRANRRDVWQS